MPLANMRFLVLEGSLYAVDLTRIMLRGFGAREIICARDIPTALDAASGSGVDVIVSGLDIKQPDDGLEFVRMLRAAGESGNPRTPVILLMPAPTRERIVVARDAGATEICGKPLSAAALFKRIHKAVHEPRRFVVSERFTGPDRRRREEGVPLRRRHADFEKDLNENPNPEQQEFSFSEWIEQRAPRF